MIQNGDIEAKPAAVSEVSAVSAAANTCIT